MEASLTIAATAAVLTALWFPGAALGLLTLSRLRRLTELESSPPSRWPRVSIVVPARNEGGTIEAATRSKLASDYPDLEVVLVNDRSEDETGSLVDGLAADDPRIRALRIEALPEGWLGKVHALARGTEAASGAWLLFADADVHLAPDALRRAVAWAEAERLDHAVVMPEVDRGGFLLDAAYSAFGRYFAISQRLWEVGRRGSSASVGVGAFNLVRREMLARTPGFAELRMDVLDDLGLGAMLARHGARAGIVAGTGLVGVRWYRDFADLARGLEKNVFVLFGCRAWRGFAAAGAMLALDLAPLAALFLPGAHPALRALAAGALSAGALVSAAGARRVGRRIFPATLIPLGTMLLAGVIVRAGVLGTIRGGIFWRGTFHSGEDVRAGARHRRIRSRRWREKGEEARG